MDIRRNKVPLTVAFMACLFVVTVMFNADRAEQARTADGIEAVGLPVIILDAGHGGMDGGAVGAGGELEKDINLAIVKNLHTMLTMSGYPVVLTRSEDRSMHSDGVEGIRNQKVSDMENRKAVVDSYKDNSLFFSIHQNRFTDSQYYGAQMFYAAVNPENRNLASILQSGFAELQPSNNREIKVIDNELFLFKSTVQPAVLIECGFLSNVEEAARLSNAEYQKQVAFTIYRGIMQYLSQ